MFSIVWGGYSFSSRRERRGWAGKIKGAELENCSSVCRFLCENETNHQWYILINIGMFRFSLLVLNQTYGKFKTLHIHLHSIYIIRFELLLTCLSPLNQTRKNQTGIHANLMTTKTGRFFNPKQGSGVPLLENIEFQRLSWIFVTFEN